MSDKHKAVRFIVGSGASGLRERDLNFATFREASGKAVAIAIQDGSATIAVVASSTFGAKWWGGPVAVAEFKARSRGTRLPGHKVSHVIELYEIEARRGALGPALDFSDGPRSKGKR